MELQKIYKEVENRIQRINFEALWENFHPFNFALYSEEIVCFCGRLLPRTDEFIANTTIYYENKWIAIWHLSEETDLDILTAKIIHEMFHAYQMEMGEKRFANEIVAVRKYRYIPKEMEIRYRENELMAELVDSFCIDTWNRLLAYRKYRKIHYAYEYQYMMQIEAIEGAAQYVETEVLRQLDPEKYNSFINMLIHRITKIDYLIPIRTFCYDTGSLFLKLCKDNRIPIDYSIGISTSAYCEKLLDVEDCNEEIIVRDEIEKYAENDMQNVKHKTLGIIETADAIYKENYQLVAFDPYGARNYNSYIYTHFLKVIGEREYMCCGDVVFLMNEFNQISEIYVKNDMQ